MENLYKILGVTKGATTKEIRKAYRSLARKYHPDINKDENSIEYFKKVTEAYNTLHDPGKRMRYDRQLDASEFNEIDAKVRAYKETQDREAAIKKQREDYERMMKIKEALLAKRMKEAKENFLAPLTFFKKLFGKSGKTSNKTKENSNSLHLNPKESNTIFIDLSLNLEEAIFGCCKIVPIPGDKKIKIKIPAGSHTADIFRTKLSDKVEVICIIKNVVAEQYASYESNGLIFNLPITIKEALLGTELSVPTFDGPRKIKIQPNTNSGYIIRLHKCGIKKENEVCDLLYRVMISVPETTLAVGIKEKAEEIDRYYEKGVRLSALKSLNSLIKNDK